MREEKRKEKVKIASESNSWLAINKPSGFVINDAKTTHGNPTIQSWVSKNISSEISNNDKLRSGVVHRLDKETSGVLLVAKTKKTFEFLQNEFKERRVQKTYIALVHGEMKGGGEIKAPIGRLPWNKKKFGIVNDGRDASTEYEVLKLVHRGQEVFSLLKIKPKTGRTHQIRVHLKHIGHPIVADPLYAGRKTLKSDKEWCSRMFLHAETLSFIDPDTGNSIEVKIFLPEELAVLV